MNAFWSSVVQSSGVLRYSVEAGVGHKLIVSVDKDIVELARALLPPGILLNRQRYAPHISVVRKEEPKRAELWGAHEGEVVDFWYDIRVCNDECYWWLKAYSDRLVEIRQELGLDSSSRLSRPPDGEDCFHITIGNTK